MSINYYCNVYQPVLLRLGVWAFSKLALHSQTGQISYVEGNRKTTDLFLELLKKLKRQYRRAKTIALFVDNDIIDKSKKAQNC